MERTTKTNKQTATVCYAERHAQCLDLLQRIASSLEQHQKNQSQALTHWALRHAAEELAYALCYLGDRSAIDAKGLAL